MTTFFSAGFFEETLHMSGPAVASGATWDSATASNVALTNGNLTATNSAADITCGVMANVSKTTGKYYFEILMLTFLDSDPTFGVATTSATFGNLYLDGTGGVTAYRTGRVYTNGLEAVGVVFNGFEDGDTLAVAVDLTNRKFWVKNIDGPNAPSDWNGILGADPATNTDGVTILAGTIVPFCTFGGTPGDFIGNAWTANFGGSAFIGSAPSGFTSSWSA